MAKHLMSPRAHGHKAQAGPATALHGTTKSGLDVVMIDKLRVALLCDGRTWVAQGLEIDYAAEGATIEEAKKQFSIGLMATLRENLRVFGNIEHVLRTVPTEMWNALMAKNVLRAVHSQVSAHKVRQMWNSVPSMVEPTVSVPPPLGGIDYYLDKHACA
jgi:hypothetical protein